METCPGGPRTRHGAGFWLVAGTFAVTMAFSAAPTPLYVLYQRRDGFGSFMITLIFAAYAIGVVASLFLAGHISDWTGRRRVLIPAVLVNVVAGVLFLGWTNVPILLIARFISGVSIGMLTATATAHLAELHLTARPGASRMRADAVATAANLGGLGLGPLVAGFLAQYVPDPLRVPYVVFEVLMLLGIVAVVMTPETVVRPGDRPAYRPQRVSIPAGSRPTYFAATAAAMAEFALFGLFTSLAPSFLAGTLHQRSHAVAGVAVFIVFGTAAFAQIALARMRPARQLATAFTALVTGLVLITVAVWWPVLPLFLVGGALAGAGAGLGFKSSVTTVLTIAPNESRGEALAGLFLAAYIGLAIPVMALGVATQILSARIAVLGFATILSTVVTTVARRLLRSTV